MNGIVIMGTGYVLLALIGLDMTKPRYWLGLLCLVLFMFGSAGKFGSGFW